VITTVDRLLDNSAVSSMQYTSIIIRLESEMI